ncbi:MAG: putative toxin-antitoxin system toxin component, PIN family [Dolichospermum sp.]|jgi:putative PIN family toxin of toxin-antitoxin system|uniref:Putative toxin-antitoxin system toxin component, PIN family n=1 Tax=Microcystis aeruginosa Ma_QC_C_20070703_M131 TaxID=2486263 RepID=A0A551X653_MICAE|nr:MAG: putative toxin-antitoxin system toxin component, PIN family [Microcystis aeruginosa Ma_QC_C_20070703_M131]
MKIIIDTNIVVSAIIADRNPERLIILVASKSDYQWIVSSEILTEYKDVLNRKKLKVTDQKKQRWLRMFTLFTTSVDVNLTIDFPRDRKDAKFLACAISSGADYLITGDKDFEDVPDLGVTKIVTVSQFLEIFTN